MHFYLNSFPRADFYVTSVSWASDTVLSVVFMNRPQNVSLHCLCRHPGYKCQVVSVNVKRHIFNIVKRYKIPFMFHVQFHTQQSIGGWVEAPSQPLFNSDLSEMLLLEEVRCHHSYSQHYSNNFILIR